MVIRAMLMGNSALIVVGIIRLLSDGRKPGLRSGGQSRFFNGMLIWSKALAGRLTVSHLALRGRMCWA